MTRLTVETYQRRHLEDMCRAYNVMTENEPHIAPLDPERFIRFVEDKSYFDPTGLFLARGGDEVVGWVHACVAGPTEVWQETGATHAHVRMLVFPSDRITVGAALVAAATDWLKESGKRELFAMHCCVGYPFYRCLWMGGEPMAPATLSHVQLAFSAAGYKNTHESIFMTAAIARRPPETDAAIALDFEESEARMAHDWMRQSWSGFEPQRITAFHGKEQVGRIGWVLQEHLDRLGAPCMNIWSLSVSENHRRKGIGAALISRAMGRAFDLGARFASVATQLWNVPAHASYAKFGFVPDRILIGRTLDLDAGGDP